MSGTNSDAGLYPLDVPTAEQWNILFTGKVDADVGYMNTPTVLGAITILNTPAADTDGVNKAYVDSKLAPGGGGSLPDAPTDSTPYCRQNNSWVPAPTTLIASVSGDLHVPGNLLVQGASQLTGNLLIGVSVVAGTALDVDGSMAVRGNLTAGGITNTIIAGGGVGAQNAWFANITAVGTHGIVGQVGLVGPVTVSGALTLPATYSATIGGFLKINGGALTSGVAASITGDTTISGGLLVGNGISMLAGGSFMCAVPASFTNAAGVSIAGGGLTLIGTTGTLTVGGDTKITGKSGFNGTTPITKPIIAGSKGGNAALASLLTALQNYGLITDGST